MRQLFTYGFIFILLGFQQLSAQISPGDLSKAHAHLEGISNCTKCHVLGEKETTSKCLECHEEIQYLINNKKGYHASTEIKDTKCAKCHGEHFGREFKLTKFDTITFNHELTGFNLIEKHGELSCEKCHNPNLIENKVSQKEGHTYLGLGTSCLSCHDDYHQNSLSRDCASCHNQSKFKPAPYFNHEKTEFQLLGKHKNVDCEKCHKLENNNGVKFQQFANVKHDNCTDCHEDVHKNKFGQNCTKCHTVESFHIANKITDFDHSKTNYPLLGKHINLDCTKCHKGSYTKSIKHELCSHCHEDYHKGQLKRTGRNSDCADCHTNESFTQTTYTIDKHNQSEFILKGSHLATPCALCHKKEETWLFKEIGTECTACHENIHKNHISNKYLVNGTCLNCHTEENWKSINFDHASTNFKLLGKHKGLDCRQCHFPVENEIITQIFNGLDQNCYTCHDDKHHKQFEENKHTNCEKCHTSNNWNPEKFNHDNTRFKLDGAHVKVDCIKCHYVNKEIGDFVVYKFKDISCKSCHS